MMPNLMLCGGPAQSAKTVRRWWPVRTSLRLGRRLRCEEIYLSALKLRSTTDIA